MVQIYSYCRSTLEHGAKLGLINNEDLTEQQEKFKKACMQYVNTLDDTDEVLFDMEKIVSRPRGDMDWWNNSDKEDRVGSSDTPMDVERKYFCSLILNDF